MHHQQALAGGDIFALVHKYPVHHAVEWHGDGAIFQVEFGLGFLCT